MVLERHSSHWGAPEKVALTAPGKCKCLPTKCSWHTKPGGRTKSGNTKHRSKAGRQVPKLQESSLPDLGAFRDDFRKCGISKRDLDQNISEAQQQLRRDASFKAPQPPSLLSPYNLNADGKSHSGSGVENRSQDPVRDASNPDLNQSPTTKDFIRGPLVFERANSRPGDEKPRVTRPCLERSSARRCQSTPAATDSDRRRYRIPSSCSMESWDPSEESTVLLGSVFDLISLAKWIYDWTIYHHGPTTRMSNLAAELLHSITDVLHNIRRIGKRFSHVRRREDKEMLEDFMQSGERLTDGLKHILKRCGVKATKQQSPNKSTPIAVIEALFGPENSRTASFVESARSWTQRFSVNCEEIVESTYPRSEMSAAAKESHLDQTYDPSNPSLKSSKTETKDTNIDNLSLSNLVSLSDDVSASEEDISETLDDDHPLLQDVSVLLQAMLRDFEGWRTRKGDPSSSSITKPAASSNGQKSTPQKKRHRKTDNKGEDSEEDADQSIRNGKRRNTDCTDVESPLLACPFYKRDKVRHQRCLKHTLKRIKDVKLHLRRGHMQPIFCPICGQVFDRKLELDHHLISRTCERQDFEAPEGLTDEQDKMLTNKVDRKLTLSEQWKSVWEILFPDEEPPESPFVQGPLQEGLLAFRQYRDERGPLLISEYVQNFIQDHDLIAGLPNEERTQSALLETVCNQVVDAIIDGYEVHVEDIQDDEDTSSSSINKSEIAAQGISSQDVGYRRDEVPVIAVTKPAVIFEGNLDDDWTGDSTATNDIMSAFFDAEFENIGLRLLHIR
ncbi:hypothetical protein F5Y15DRAFT_380969 [Xylariaceae sp. FL0016]|nr:hypothetical protein F5Y15DRAFT_380969 [Xylariaceae sp. FL0016]